MIEDYISRLQQDNKEKLNSYDKEMQELTEELSAAEKLLSQLEKDKQDDKNIFSPRSFDSGRDQEIQKTQDQVQALKQRLEYVSQMVEEEMKNGESYRELAREAQKESGQRGDQDILDFLESVYKKVERSFSLLNGNKNQCRSELKSIEQMIRSYEDRLQKGGNS